MRCFSDEHVLYSVDVVLKLLCRFVTVLPIYCVVRVIRLITNNINCCHFPIIISYIKRLIHNICDKIFFRWIDVILLMNTTCLHLNNSSFYYVKYILDIIDSRQSILLTLEECFSGLEEIIEKMQDTEVSLEDSFALYEQGMKMLKNCNQKIDAVEKKMLKMNEQGELEEF